MSTTIIAAFLPSCKDYYNIVDHETAISSKRIMNAGESLLYNTTRNFPP